MPRIAIFNMFLGFFVLAMAALAGVFQAFDLTDAYLKGAIVSPQWQRQLLQSAHGHSNLFAMIHILFGLTLTYSDLKRFGTYLTMGLALGTTAMGPLMMARAYRGPAPSLDSLGVIMGGFLTLAISAIICHGYGLFIRWYRHQ